VETMKLKRLLPLMLIGVAALTIAASTTPLEATTVVPSMQDAEIRLAVDNELLVARGVESDSIDVATSLGVVTLTGTVDNVLAADRAERIASTVKGVRSVVNRLEVLPQRRSDDEIEADVRATLARDQATDSWQIEVDSERGVVTLRGEADSWHEMRLAETIAKGVTGVALVNNRIEVSESEERSDAEIRTDIESALQWESRIDDGLIEVDVAEGNVRLTGSVGSAFEKRLADEKSHVVGVKSVESGDLNIAWWARNDMLRKDLLTGRNDEATRKAILDAFLVDPRINALQPSVEVANGVATLTGTVESLKAKRAAAKDAANTTGIWRVRNYLKVRPAEQRSDAEVAQDVRAFLQSDPYVERFDIAVNVDQGRASLMGTVDSHFEKWQAEDLAARTRGVIAIQNMLSVSFEPFEGNPSFYDWDAIESDYDFEPLTLTRRADWEIRQDIEQEMRWSPFVDGDQVKVDVDDGYATLTGTVDSLTERRQAEEEAYEGGAVAVDNDLMVRWPPDLPLP